jgi:hypothetical protein
MDATRREFLAGTTAVALCGCSAAAVSPAGVLTPEEFGATGNGQTNDTDAFAALSAAVNSRGGGTIVLRPVTYIVGKHARRGSTALNGRKSVAAFPPGEILHFVGCRAPVIVRGNGATLRAAGGLRFGTFDPQTGHPFEHPMPFKKREFVASPYSGMIVAERCHDLVEISDIELDGNLQGLEIGGKFGNKGWQIPATGIRLMDNAGPERLSAIYSHHHALDGLTLYSPPDRTSSTSVSNVRSEYNARQGCSLTGGRNYVFQNCRFLHTGKSVIHSGPGAGFDIEAQGRAIREVHFVDCEFADNRGVGLVADSGDSADISFTRCKFVGTSNWSAWPKKPGMRFDACTVVGTLVHPYGDPDSARAAQFVNCDFLDDPALSPTGEIYIGAGARHAIVNAPDAMNVLFQNCRFRMTGEGALPFTTDVSYSDCDMSQSYPVTAYPRGTYIGSNRLNGNIDLKGSEIAGIVTLNGRVVPKTA